MAVQTGTEWNESRKARGDAAHRRQGSSLASRQVVRQTLGSPVQTPPQQLVAHPPRVAGGHWLLAAPSLEHSPLPWALPPQAACPLPSVIRIGHGQCLADLKGRALGLQLWFMWLCDTLATLAGRLQDVQAILPLRHPSPGNPPARIYAERVLRSE